MKNDPYSLFSQFPHFDSILLQICHLRGNRTKPINIISSQPRTNKI